MKYPGTKSKKASAPATRANSAGSSGNHDIFISHASADKAVAEKLVDILLTNGCDVSAKQILCTSLEGMKIPAGTPSFIDFLRGEIQNPKLVILLLTENYFASEFCVCELGAAWGMGLTTFPLVIPPLDKGSLKGTLMVTQAGDILDTAYLDELLDVVKAKVGSQPATQRWTVKRDEFIRSARKIIKKLPKPSTVNRSELEQAERNYQQALDEIESKDEEVDDLKAKIADLENCKDAGQVKAVRKKYSSEREEFEELCIAASHALADLEWVTKEAFYQAMRENEYLPEPEDRDLVKRAEEHEEIQEGHTGYIPNDPHPKVSTAQNALRELSDFMEKLEEESDFPTDFVEEKDYPFSFTNRKFWNEHLL